MKISSQYMSYTFILHVTLKIKEAKTHSNTSTAKLSVTPRVNPPYLKCIHMIEKHVYIRGVINSLTEMANMLGWTSVLKVEFRSLIRCYGLVVFHNIIRWKTVWRKQVECWYRFLNIKPSWSRWDVISAAGAEFFLSMLLPRRSCLFIFEDDSCPNAKAMNLNVYTSVWCLLESDRSSDANAITVGIYTFVWWLLVGCNFSGVNVVTVGVSYTIRELSSLRYYFRLISAN